MDIIYIRDLNIQTTVGILPWETKMPQSLRLSLELGTPFNECATSDSIDDTIDYKKVCDRLQNLAKARHFNLLEALAEYLARHLLDEFPINWCRLSIGKVGILKSAKEVGVTIERGSQV